MANKDVILHDDEENDLYPVTRTSNVYDSSTHNLDELLAGKQASLSTSQLNAVNSGVTSSTVAQVSTNTNNISQMSNPNLLINGDFRVNQRGQSVYSFSTLAAYTRTYTVDRWRFVNQVANSTSTVTVNSNSITVYCANQYDNISQLIEDYDKFAGKTVTASIKIKSVSGTGFAFRINVDGTQQAYKSLTTTGIFSFTATLPNTINSSLQFSIVNNASSTGSIEIEWCKLEIGSIPTIFSPRPYAEELALCQRYYITYDGTTTATTCVGYANSDTVARFSLILPTTSRMRTNPTFKLGDTVGTIQIIYNGQSLTPTAIDYYGMNNNCITFSLTTSGLTFAYPLVVRPLQNISFDAEIY